MQKSAIKILTSLLGFILILTLMGGLITGCDQAEEKKEEKTEKTEEKKETEEKVTEFENPDLVVTTDWLQENLSDKEIKIVDVRAEGEYGGGHIEGALNLPLDKTNDAANPIPSEVATKAQMEDALSNLGISNKDKIVVYDGGGMPFAGRVYWALTYYGHKDASILEGGLKKWQAEGKKVQFEAPKVTKTTYTAKANPDVNATKDQVKEWVDEKSKDVVLVDTRPQAEWDTGHLPGAVRLDWVELFTNSDPTTVFKSAEELQKLLDDNGITKEKEVVLY